jgi:hypothetical protein
MSGGRGKGGRHQKPTSPDTEAALQEAVEALTEARAERRRVEQRAGFVERLREGWERVHERNNLARLFTDALESGRMK